MKWFLFMLGNIRETVLLSVTAEAEEESIWELFHFIGILKQDVYTNSVPAMPGDNCSFPRGTTSLTRR